MHSRWQLRFSLPQMAYAHSGNTKHAVHICQEIACSELMIYTASQQNQKLLEYLVVALKD